ncbi:hypothetical protein [Nocardia sp. NPDC050175]|uniref:hypothetical protein n=1 Tax=Nocardia sp. NPDC050175 TaxID=3364317 RepID=UPI0037AC9F01
MRRRAHQVAEVRAVLDRIIPRPRGGDLLEQRSRLIGLCRPVGAPGEVAVGGQSVSGLEMITVPEEVADVVGTVA